MKTQRIITSNLANFGFSERKELIQLLTAWHEQGLPEGFYDEDVIPMFNRNSGFVFLSNSECQTCMMNGSKLELWHNCSNCGNEGFEEDCHIEDDGDHCNECKTDFSELDDNSGEIS